MSAHNPEYLRLFRINQLPVEFWNGRWHLPSGGRSDAIAIIVYDAEPCPETGHVGWCWWARGKMGEAKTYEDAKRQAEAKLEALKCAPYSSTGDIDPGIYEGTGKGFEK